MFRIIIDGLVSNLNLTTMVESKQQRIVTYYYYAETARVPSSRNAHDACQLHQL